MIWEMVNYLHFMQTMPSFHVENLFHSPWQSPQDVPVIFALAFLPTSFFEILNQNVLVKIGFVFKACTEVLLIVLVCLVLVVHFYFIILDNCYIFII